MRRASPPRAGGYRGDRPQAHRGGQRPADRPGGPGRPAGPGRPVQSGSRCSWTPCAPAA